MTKITDLNMNYVPVRALHTESESGIWLHLNQPRKNAAESLELRVDYLIVNKILNDYKLRKNEKNINILFDAKARSLAIIPGERFTLKNKDNLPKRSAAVHITTNAAIIKQGFIFNEYGNCALEAEYLEDGIILRAEHVD